MLFKSYTMVGEGWPVHNEKQKSVMYAYDFVVIQSISSFYFVSLNSMF